MKLDYYENELLEISNKVIATMIKKGVMVEDAKDIVQSSILKLLEFNGSIPFDSLQAWLYRVSFNHYYTEYNRYQKLKEIEEIYLKPKLFEIEETEFDESFLLEALLRLKETEFNLILLKYIEKLSYKELSIIFDKSEEVLKTESYRIRKTLKKIIQELKENDE